MKYYLLTLFYLRRREEQDESCGRQSVLLRKRQTEADTKIGGVNTDYYYDTMSGVGSTKLPLASGSEINGTSVSPATEPLMAAESTLQRHLANTNGTSDRHVVTVRCWPNDRNGRDATMTSCSTFKVVPDKTAGYPSSQLNMKDSAGYAMQQTLPILGRGAV